MVPQKRKFQLFLWESSSHISLAGGHFLLVLVNKDSETRTTTSTRFSQY